MVWGLATTSNAEAVRDFLMARPWASDEARADYAGAFREGLISTILVVQGLSLGAEDLGPRGRTNVEDLR